MSTVALINYSPKNSGIRRYVYSIYPYLKKSVSLVNFDYQNKKIYSNNLPLTSQKTFITNKYFWINKNRKNIPKSSLYHLSTQYLSFLNLKPKIITCHDLLPLFYPDSFLTQTLEKFLFRGLTDAVKIIAISQNSKKDIINYFRIKENKIKVIYQGVNSSLFYPKGNEDNGFIFHISNEGKHKNVPFILNALKVLEQRGKIKNIKLLKAGKAFNIKERKNNTELVKKLKLDDNVKFFNDVSDEKLVNFYRSASVFVYPSLYEGFGLPVLEAMASGCPVIAGNTSSLPEIVGNAGILINPEDVSGFANAIEKVLTNKNLRMEMIERGIEQAKKFSWEKCAKETLKVYKEFV